MAGVGWRERYFESRDGLRLFARDYGPEESDCLPVLCLSGLTRNAKDSHLLAERLAGSRRVIAPDYRGRGRSQYAADWKTYRPDVELADAIALLDRLAISRVVVMGTSRGGLIAMLMAAAHRDRMAGVLLNDIGPKLETGGLLRIRGYLGVPPAADSWDGAVEDLKRSQAGFASLTEAEWLAFAHRLYRDDGGRPAMDYDPNLALAFPSAEQIAAGDTPELWELLGALGGMPACVVRGEQSDLLSEETVDRMALALPGLDVATVEGRGHAPFLDEPESVRAIDDLLARTG